MLPYPRYARCHAAGWRAQWRRRASRAVARRAVTQAAVTKTWLAEWSSPPTPPGCATSARTGRRNWSPSARRWRPCWGGAAGGGVWHLIGPVQSRKSDLVAAHADGVPAPYRLKTSGACRPIRLGAERCPASLRSTAPWRGHQVGLDLREWEKSNTTGRTAYTYTDAAGLPGLSVMGLMTMVSGRRWTRFDVFQRTRRGRVVGRGDGIEPAVGLSMGTMTDDSGDRHRRRGDPRPGRALFGERDQIRVIGPEETSDQR